MYRIPLLTGPGYKRILGIVVQQHRRANGVRRHSLERTLIHMAATRTSRKNTAQQAELTSAANLPAPAPSVEVVESAPPGMPVLTFIVASDKVRENTENRVAALFAETALHTVRGQKSADALAEANLRLRRMFPAPATVQAILGEDAPDLYGRSPEYRAAVERINESARDGLINALRKEGMTIKGATKSATDELESLRKSVSRAIRIQLDADLKPLGDEGARILLANGFGYNGEVGKNQLLAKGDKLVDGKVVRAIAPAADAPPVEPADQATATETAEAQATQDAAEMGTTTNNPQGRINLAVGELNTARADKRLFELPAKDRVALARLIGVAAFEAMLAIGESLTGSDRVQVARMFEQISTVTSLRLDPQTEASEVAPAAK